MVICRSVSSNLFINLGHLQSQPTGVDQKTVASILNSMLKVELTNKTNNPFYGMRNCLELYQSAGKGSVNESLLDRCFLEVQDSKEKREMFYSLLFSIGDITARQHNIFRGAKVDSGGNAQREAFHIV